ncbi:MAG TPA: FtsX-like permease family protein, partial [Ornithinicoccus sp.]|nr:FtsX-like permease family protein [Ornithinicoccus sp.]
SVAALARGSDIRAVPVSTPVSGTTLSAVPTLEGTPGIDASAPVWLADGRVGASVVSFTALPVDRLADAARVPEGVFDVSEVADVLRGPTVPSAGVPLPGTATSLDLTVELDLTPPADLQEAVDQSYEEAKEQFSSGEGADPTDPEFMDFVEQMAWEQVGLELREFTQGKELSTVLWFWDASSTTLLRVEAPPIPFEFDVSLNELPGTPRVSASPTETTATVQVPVAAAPGRSLVGIDLGLPQTGRFYDFEARVTGLEASNGAADDTDLLADPALADWESPIPTGWPEADNLPSPTVGTLQAGATGLVLTGTTGREELSTFQNEAVGVVPLRAPGLGGKALAGPDPGVGADGSAQTDGSAAPIEGVDPSPGGGGGALPVAITRSLADTAEFQVGAPITIQAFGRNVPAEIAAIVTAVPGSTAPHSVLVDSSALSTYLASIGQAMDPPSQLWATSSDPESALEAVRQVPGIAAATGVATTSVTDAAGAVRLVFWVASAGAVLLAVTGIGAVAANLLSVRRPEVSVLRALGMTPGGQARARTAELLWVVLASIGLGLLAGWLVGRLVVPELSRSTTLAGQVQLPAPLVLEVPLWAGLLLALAGALLLLLAVLYVTVRRQALDNEYREEIR